MRDLRSQKEIMASWKGDLDKPVVSICCITYSHESYIEDALEGFLIQETDFPFEILIHDDASSDRTAEIIREYETKYPLLIKPIYQSENQYSKGLKVNPVFNLPRAKGEFIALCEGDDYWTDRKKLQKQTDVMKKYDDISICYHDSIVMYGSDAGTTVERKIKNREKFQKNATQSELIKGFKISTQSMMIKSEVIDIYPKNSYAFGGDKILVFLAGLLGRGEYIKDINPSVFRIHQGGVNRGKEGILYSDINRIRTALMCYQLCKENSLSLKYKLAFIKRMFFILIKMFIKDLRANQ